MHMGIPGHKYDGCARDMKEPMLRRWPIAVHLPRFLWNKPDFPDTCARMPGAVSGLSLGGTTMLLRDPEDIRFVPEARPELFGKTVRLTNERGMRLSGRGLLRMCIGPHPARIEVALIPALLVRDLKLERGFRPPVKPSARMTLRPAGPVWTDVSRANAA